MPLFSMSEARKSGQPLSIETISSAPIIVRQRISYVPSFIDALDELLLLLDLNSFRYIKICDWYAPPL
jgi:hypothetical protein